MNIINNLQFTGVYLLFLQLTDLEVVVDADTMQIQVFLEGTEEDVAKATVADERDFFLRMIQVQMIVLFFIEG